MSNTDAAPTSFLARLISDAIPQIKTWLVCAAVLGIVFLPVFVIPYAHHDQYRHFSEPRGYAAFKRSCTNDPQYRYLYLLGRPIAAETECIIFEHTTQLSDLIVFRFWVVALLALAATCYAKLLHSTMTRLASVALSLAIFTLPGAQNAVFMTNLANVLAPLLATLSYLALNRAQERYENRHRLATAGWASLAVLLLLSAFLTYPFLALFFFCATVAHLLFADVKDWGTQAWRLLRDTGVLGAAAALYWSVAKLALFPRDPTVIARLPVGYRPFVDFSGITGRVSFLLKDVTPRVLTLWYVYPLPLLTACVLVVMCAGISLHLWRGGLGVPDWHRKQLLGGLAIVLLLAASAGPFLLIPAPFLYRLFFSTGAMMVMLLFWSATQIIAHTGLVRFFRDAGERIGIALCAAGCMIATINTTVNTQNSFLEFAYVKAQIAAARGSEIQRIHVVQPRGSVSFNGLPAITDEFNRPTTSYAFDMAFLVRLALTEMRAQSKYVLDGGGWIATANSRKPCAIRSLKHGQIEITDDTGTSSEASLNKGRIVVAGGRQSGIVAADLMTIRWNNGTIWTRREGRYPLAGNWTFVRSAEAGSTTESTPVGPASIKRLSDTRWLLTIEYRSPASATENGPTLQVPDWGISGFILPNLSQIRWSNGTIWERQISDEAALEGKWTKLDAYGTGELMVTTSQFGEPVLRSPNMVVVDMNALVDSVGVGDLRLTAYDDLRAPYVWLLSDAAMLAWLARSYQGIPLKRPRDPRAKVAVRRCRYYVAGWTESTDFTPAGIQPRNAGGTDAFVAKSPPNRNTRGSQYTGRRGDGSRSTGAFDTPAWPTSIL